jgi:uncharacterized protein
LDRGINLSLIFEWDPRKAAANAGKHGIEFSEAIAVFDDLLARIFPDDWHSENEPREMIIGHLDDRRLCLVVFTEISEDRLRIISARLATPKEQRDYERNAR